MAKQSRLRNQRVSYRCATGEEIVEKANRGSKARHRQEKEQEGGEEVSGKGGVGG